MKIPLENEGELAMQGKSGNTVQSVMRAVEILRCFEKEPELGITEISRMVGLHKSTTSGLVSTLAQASLLAKNPKTDKYQLGMGLFSLGMLVKHDLRSVAQPYLIQLVEQSQETVNLVTQDGPSVVYISKIESPHSMRICTQIGKNMPMYCTAVGKSILAYLDQEEVLSILDQDPPEKFTENTLTDLDSILKALTDIRAKGYALDQEELEYGLTCVAVPILNKAGKPIASISVSGPTSRMDSQLIEKCHRLLKNYGEQIGGKF